MATATAAALSPPERRGRAIAVVVTGQSIAVALGAPLGAWVARYLRLAADLFRDRCACDRHRGDALRPVAEGADRRDTNHPRAASGAPGPGLRRALLMTVAFTMGGFMVVSFILTMTTDGMGLPASLQPLVLLASGAGAIVGNQLGGQLVDRIGCLSNATDHDHRARYFPRLAAADRAIAGGLGGAGLSRHARRLPVSPAGASSRPSSVTCQSSRRPPHRSRSRSTRRPSISASRLAAILGGIVLEQFGVLQLGLVGGLIVAGCAAGDPPWAAAGSMSRSTTPWIPA